MTNEEAIQFLDNIKGEETVRMIGKEGFYAELLGYHIEALNKAIEALKNERDFEKEYMKHYAQGRKDERAILNGELFQSCSELEFKKEGEDISSRYGEDQGIE